MYKYKYMKYKKKCADISYLQGGSLEDKYDDLKKAIFNTTIEKYGDKYLLISRKRSGVESFKKNDKCKYSWRLSYLPSDEFDVKLYDPKNDTAKDLIYKIETSISGGDPRLFKDSQTNSLYMMASVVVNGIYTEYVIFNLKIDEDNGIVEFIYSDFNKNKKKLIGSEDKNLIPYINNGELLLIDVMHYKIYNLSKVTTIEMKMRDFFAPMKTITLDKGSYLSGSSQMLSYNGKYYAITHCKYAIPPSHSSLYTKIDDKERLKLVMTKLEALDRTNRVTFMRACFAYIVGFYVGKIFGDIDEESKLLARGLHPNGLLYSMGIIEFDSQFNVLRSSPQFFPLVECNISGVFFASGAIINEERMIISGGLNDGQPGFLSFTMNEIDDILKLDNKNLYFYKDLKFTEFFEYLNSIYDKSGLNDYIDEITNWYKTQQFLINE